MLTIPVIDLIGGSCRDNVSLFGCSALLWSCLPLPLLPSTLPFQRKLSDDTTETRKTVPIRKTTTDRRSQQTTKYNNT